LYILQLVQALRYERYDLINANGVDSMVEEQNNSNENSTSVIGPSDSTSSDAAKSSPPNVDLSTFLIQRACEKPIVASYLFWYAYVECENNNVSKDKAISDMYQAFVKRLSSTLKSGNALTQQVRSSIEAQKKFVDKLVELTNYKVKQHLQIVKIQL
jgi:phosphatidylinositol 3-kinase